MARGLLASLEHRASPENPDTPLTSSALLSLFGAEPTDSGVSVTESKALGLTAVLAAQRIISEAVGSVPKKVRQRIEGGSVDAPEHWAYTLLHDRPNPEMSSMTFFELLQHHALGWGNAYAEIQWTRDRSRWGALWPLLPDRTRAYRRNGVKLIETEIREDGEWRKAILPADRVLHIPGLGFNGLSGYSPIQIARQALGAGLAVDAYAGKFFGQGASMGGVLEHPKTLSDPALARLRESSPILTGGLSQAHRWAVLEEGMKANPFRVNPEDSQLLESRKFTIGEVSRIFGPPPHMLADIDRPFQSNVEQMGIQFVMYTLRGWIVRFEQAINWQLFPKAERRTYYVEFVLEGLLRGDYKSRMDGHKIGLETGLYNRDTILAMEGQNPIGGDLGQGRVLQQNQVLITADGKIVPLNGPEKPTDAGAVTDDSSSRAEPTSNAGRRRFRDAFLQVFRRDAERIVKGEVGAIRRAVEQVLEAQGRAAFVAWLDGYYGDKTRAFIRETSETAVRSFWVAVATEALAETGAPADRSLVEVEAEIDRNAIVYIDVLVERHVASSKEQLGALIADPDIGDDSALAEAVRVRLAEWEENRPEELARDRARWGGGSAALAAWGLAGEDCLVAKA